MKRKAVELDVDFIGGQDPMTNEEEKAISEFIKARKLLTIKNKLGQRWYLKEKLTFNFNN